MSRPARLTHPTRTTDELPHSCGKCTNKWSGANTAHCANCHQTFSGVTTFDKHRHNGHCVAPADLGLTLDERRPYECWGNNINENDD